MKRKNSRRLQYRNDGKQQPKTESCQQYLYYVAVAHVASVTQTHAAAGT